MSLSSTMAEVRYRVAANIRHYRTLRQLTRNDLAERALLHHRVIDRAELPNGPNMSLVTLIKIATALGVEVTDLFSERALTTLPRGISIQILLKQSS